jgi:hypothetical protein
VGSLVAKAMTVDQAKAILTFVEAISEKTLRSTVTLTAGRGLSPFRHASLVFFNPKLVPFLGAPTLLGWDVTMATQCHRHERLTSR